MLPHFKTDNFRMSRLFFNSIDTSLTASATEQNAATKQTPQYQSVAQFYRDLQAKGNFTANPEEIAKLTTEFASKTNGALNVTNFVSAALRPACNSSFEPITK